MLLFVSFLLFTLTGCGSGGSVEDIINDVEEADVIAPDIPQQLTAQAESATSILLTWIESGDNVATTGYRVIRDENVIAEIDELQYLDTNLAPATTYNYTVTAFDANNNESSQSESVSATTLNTSVNYTAPEELIGHAFSGTSIGLSWLKNNITYTIFRDDIRIAETVNNYFVDSGLDIDTVYIYKITATDITDESTTSTVTTKTLIDSNNNGTNNGSETIIVNDRISNFDECNNERLSLNVADEILDTCLQAMLDYNNMASHLEDMRAFAARVRREQAPAMVELGMRLFHSKSLSANGDTSCSSCHHPALGCGGDDLSMPIGVNAIDPELLGPGRSDGNNSVPIVPRNSPATCNTSLWTRGLFWDNRVALEGRGLTTDSTDVTNNTIAAVGDNSTLILLTAQAHFPVTAASEMGDITQFGYDDTDISEHTAYRETVIVDNLNSADWEELFTAAFGNGAINYTRISEAIATYEAVQIFINNPFFDYVDGNEDALSIDEKRGAITFMASSTGCTFCHAGAFFTTQAPLPGNYPQIGIGTNSEGNGADEGAVGRSGPGAFRAPSLLNVAITGPWGHNGQFATLKRNVEHYRNHGESITRYFANNEMCALEQFTELPDCEVIISPNALALSEEILAGNEQFSNGLGDEEIDLVVKFLATLTDPDAANINSNAIQALIPTRDGGPDGNQLDAKNQHENKL